MKYLYLTLSSILLAYIIIVLFTYLYQRKLLYHPSENNYSGDEIKFEYKEVFIEVDKDIKLNLLDKIISSINFEGPFSLTTDYLHKFNIGDNINISNDLGDLNIKQCIVEYIKSLDVDNKLEVIKRTIGFYNQFV